jgi:restriction endonuclease Mrr
MVSSCSSQRACCRWLHDDEQVTDSDVPQYHELLWPTLTAVSELGGPASIGEIVEAVVKREAFTEGQQAVLHNDGPNTEIGYRLAWARTYLKGMGLLTNSQRGVWALTEQGTVLLTDPGMDDAAHHSHQPRPSSSTGDTRSGTALNGRQRDGRSHSTRVRTTPPVMRPRGQPGRVQKS